MNEKKRFFSDRIISENPDSRVKPVTLNLVGPQPNNWYIRRRGGTYSSRDIYYAKYYGKGEGGRGMVSWEKKN